MYYDQLQFTLIKLRIHDDVKQKEQIISNYYQEYRGIIKKFYPKRVQQISKQMSDAFLSPQQQCMQQSQLSSLNIQQTIISSIDKCLQHLNGICQANIVVQDVYIELLKEKKTMRFDQIKKIYMTLTEGKAKQILFEKEKGMLVKMNYRDHEGLVRLCWRSFEKLVRKITYYMVNETHLAPISRSVLTLIYLNQQFFRRSQKIKNSSMLFIIKFMQKLIQQNVILQRKIYDILLNRGYVVSLDEFYKLNGYDADHRESYDAMIKEQQQDQQQQSNEREKQKHQIKMNKGEVVSSMLHTKLLGRKKKIYRSDYRSMWKQKVIQDQQKSSLPLNKTNFQIKQGFNQLIGDLLSNNRLTEVFNRYNSSNQQDNYKKPHNLLLTKRSTQLLNQPDLTQKRIFESKIQSILTQLKTNNITVNSKLLQIINNSTTQAINSKHNLISQRKNTFATKQINNLTTQRKLRQSYIIKNSNLINRNLYRELLKRNVEMENVINQEVVRVTVDKIRKEMRQGQRTEQGHVVGFTIVEQHNQNSSPTTAVGKLKKKSILSNTQKTKTSFIFKSAQKSKPTMGDQNLLKRNSRVLERETTPAKLLREVNLFDQFVQGEKSLTEKIRITKEDWEVRNQRGNMMGEIQISQFDPLDPKITQIVNFLNNPTRDVKIDPLLRQLFTPSPSHYQSRFTHSQNDWLRTEHHGQHIATSPKVRYLSSDFDPCRKTHSTNFYSRIRTETSCGRRDRKTQSGFFQQLSNSRTRLYEVFDRRMRRVIRQ